MKRAIKVVVFILTIILIIFLVIAYSFGGFGKKEITDLAFEHGDSMLIFAHRGILNYYPEHSRDGANAAIQLGFNAIEIDIRKTSDDELVVFHDATAERMLGIDKPVDSLSLSEIQKSPLLYRNNATANHVLSVDEFFALYRKEFIIYCDMKITRFKDVEKLVSLIKKHSGERTCIMASADFFIIEYLEMKHPEMITAMEGFDSGKEWSYYFIPKNLRPDYYSGFIQNVDAKHVEWLKEKGLLQSRIVYGVDKSNFNITKKNGIKNIIMDYDSTFEDLRINIRPIR